MSRVTDTEGRGNEAISVPPHLRGGMDSPLPPPLNGYKKDVSPENSIFLGLVFFCSAGKAKFYDRGLKAPHC